MQVLPLCTMYLVSPTTTEEKAEYSIQCQHLLQLPTSRETGHPSHPGVGVKCAVDNGVRIRFGSFQHVFDVFTKLVLICNGVGPVDSKELPSVALQHSIAFLADLF